MKKRWIPSSEGMTQGGGGKIKKGHGCDPFLFCIFNLQFQFYGAREVEDAAPADADLVSGEAAVPPTFPAKSSTPYTVIV